MLLLPFKSGCMWLTDADCGTLGLAPVDVCNDDVVAFVLLLPLAVQLLLAPQPAPSSEVTVLLGAVTVPLLLRKCLKENVDDDDVDDEKATPVPVLQLGFDAAAVDVAPVAVAAAAAAADVDAADVVAAVVVVAVACGVARMLV